MCLLHAVQTILHSCRLVLVGNGIVKSEGTVKAVSRGGDRSASSSLCVPSWHQQIGAMMSEELFAKLSAKFLACSIIHVSQD